MCRSIQVQRGQNMFLSCSWILIQPISHDPSVQHVKSKLKTGSSWIWVSRMLIIFFKTRYFLATFWCCLFRVCVQRWNRGCYSSEICSVSLRLLWEDLKREDWWSLWEDTLPRNQKRESRTFCSSWLKSSLFAFGGNSIFYAYHCDTVTIPEKERCSTVGCTCHHVLI